MGMYCLVVSMTFPNCPEIVTQVHHFDCKEKAEEQLIHYKKWYIQYFEFKNKEDQLYSVDEFDAALNDGTISDILYANDFSMNNSPFEWQLISVALNTNRHPPAFYNL